MKKETITRIKLTASEGHILTDGENYGKVVYLASGDDGDKWHEISDGEYHKRMEEREISENMPV